MKKIALAAFALAAGLTAAHADEMPILGTCTNGTDTVKFSGSKMPAPDPVTGDFGLVHIFMNNQDYEKMGLNRLETGNPGSQNGWTTLGFGELGAEATRNPDIGIAIIGMSTGNFKIIFEGGKDQPAYGLPGGPWTCEVRPNF